MLKVGMRTDLELICDRASILSKGELKQIIEMDDRQDDKGSTWEIICRGDALDLSAIKKNGKIKHLVTGNRNILSTTDKTLAGRMMDEIKQQKIDLISFGSRRKSIEDMYIKSVTVEGNENG